MNYQEIATSGSMWTRSNKVTISNPYNQTPSVHFEEERVIQLDGGAAPITNPNPRFLSANFDATASFPLLDPVTGEPTGATATHQELYVMLHSLYIKTATDSDAQAAADAAAMAAQG